jgi:hypothetical protein
VWSKLDKANKSISDINGQERQISPYVEKWKTWDDMLTASLGIGIARRIDVLGVTLWPEIYLDYGSGPLENSQKGLPSEYGMLSYKYREAYTTKIPQLGVMAEIYKAKGFTFLAGAYGVVGILDSKMVFQNSMRDIASARVVKAKFSDTALGFAPNIAAEYDLGKGYALSLAYMYMWLKHTGRSEITDHQKSPQGTSTQAYTSPTEVDLTGHNVQIKLIKRFRGLF